MTTLSSLMLNLWLGCLLKAAAAVNSSTSEISTDATMLPSQVVPPHLLNDFPSEITLRGGVLHAPPFAYVESTEEGSYRYSGLQPDLLERLKIFAAQDGVNLQFNLTPSPPVWDDALDLVAHDCEQTLRTYYQEELEDDKYNHNDCRTFDLIVGEYTSTAARFQRADFTPPFLQSAIGAMKYVGPNRNEEWPAKDVDTLTQANQMGATICGQAGGFTMRTVMRRFPNAEYILCDSQAECFDHLREGRCSLLTRDKLSLKGKAFADPTNFEVTAEVFNTYYLVWPMKYDLPPVVSYLLKRWIHIAVRNTTLDELYYKYFEKDLCPIGTAGKDCESPCDAEHGAADIQGQCICESTKWSGEDCSIEIQEYLNLIPLSLKILAYAMFAMNGAVILACATWLFSHWSSDEVRASQPHFLLMVLLGCLISSSTILAMAQEDNDGKDPDAACMAIPWLYSVGFCVTFGTLFAKIRRVHMLFKQSASQSSHQGSDLSGLRMSMRQKNLTVSFQETLCIIGSVTLVDVAILVAWTVHSPLRWSREVVQETQFGEPLESQGFCTSDAWMIFGGMIALLHLFLLATATFLCYKARAIPTRFQEGKYVSIAMMSNLQIFMLGVPILIIVGSDPRAGFFVRAAIIWMNDLAVVLLIFGNLVFRTNVVNVRDSVIKRDLNKAVLSYSNPGILTSSERTPDELNSSRQVPEEEPPVDVQVGPVPLHSPMPEPEPSSTAASLPRSELMSSLTISAEFGVGSDSVREGGRSTRISSLTWSTTKKGSNRSVTFGPDTENNLPLGVPVTTKEEEDGMRRYSYDQSVARFSAADCHGQPPTVPKRPPSISKLNLGGEEESMSRGEASDLTSATPLSIPRPLGASAVSDPLVNGNPLRTLSGHRSFATTPVRFEAGGKQAAQGAPARPERLVSEAETLSNLDTEPTMLPSIPEPIRTVTGERLVVESQVDNRFIPDDTLKEKLKKIQRVQGAPLRPERLVSEVEAPSAA